MRGTKMAAIAAGGVLVLSVTAAITTTAMAHQCTTETSEPEEPGKGNGKGRGNPNGEPTTTTTCEPSDVYPNWRDNVVPVADLTDRDDEQQRRDAQRWRDENGCLTQFCVWADPSASVDDPDGPATVHAGVAGDHSLTEGAHSDEGHAVSEFGNHDSHGGAIYVDLCAGSAEGSSMDGQAGACRGPSDTQAGVTVVDHLTCPIGCADEYHVVRPLDQPYTEEQVADSQRDVGEIGTDPMRYACGYEEFGSSCYGAAEAPSLP